ncbi:hypothetical protein ACLB2K_026023 [Fragaria x ananassa]
MLKDLYNKLDEVKRNNLKRGDAESAIDWLRMKGREEGHLFGRFTPDPMTVLTDGDEVIRTVLKILMPMTQHRLCAWHIGKNIGQNVEDVEVQKQLGKMVYALYTIDEWEEAWGEIVAKHGLEEDPWITALYEKRDRFHSGVCVLRNHYLLDDYKSKDHKRKFDSHLKSIEEDAFNTFTDDIFVVIKGQIMLENRFNVRSCVQFDGSGDLMFYLS